MSEAHKKQHLKEHQVAVRSRIDANAQLIDPIDYSFKDILNFEGELLSFILLFVLLFLLLYSCSFCIVFDSGYTLYYCYYYYIKKNLFFTRT